MLITDHIALKQIKTMRAPKAITERWLDLLSNFDFTIQHRPGKNIPNVDYLSRNNQPHRKEDKMLEVEDGEIECHINSIMLRYGLIEQTDWKKLQMDDPNLRIVRGWIAKGATPEKHQLK